jgi:fatty-acyl-CoA synthase
MHGLMQNSPLTINSLLRRCEQYFGTKRIVTRTVGGIQRSTYAEFVDRTRRLATALDDLGLAPDARVATFGWNTQRHMELYFAVPCTGRVLHTLNIRLFPEQLDYIVEHAQDEAVFVDRSLLPVFAPHLARLTGLRYIVVMDDGAAHELPDDPRIMDYESLIAGVAPADLDGRVVDEEQAAALCYTSGTTGDPKGVLYSHRSTWLHSQVLTGVDSFALSVRDTLLPVVPMFHVNAWGLPYAVAASGADMIMPGPDLSPGALVELIESERVTVAAGVPTIWMAMLPMLAGRDVSSLNRIISGGSATPRSLSDGYEAAIGVRLTSAWGMTEMSPLGSLAIARPEIDALPVDQRNAVLATAGIAPNGVEMRIVDSYTEEVLPWDDEAVGELHVRGPWVAAEYFGGQEDDERFAPDGWLRTGDISAISPLGYARLVDRSKDLVKSGGEWISSVDLENAIMSHPDVAEAAVIAMPHPKWSERPMACVVRRPGTDVTQQAILDHLRPLVATWWLPDEVVFVLEIPKTSVGKFSKRTLRDQFADHVLATVKNAD